MVKLGLKVETKVIPKDCITIFVVEKEREAYQAAVGPGYRIVSGEKGVVNQRRFIENFYPAGTHIVSIDDNVIRIGHDVNRFPTLHSFFLHAFDACVEHGAFIWGVYPEWKPSERTRREEISTSLNFIAGTFYGYINRPGHLPPIHVSYNSEAMERTLLYYEADGKVLRFNRVGYKVTNFPGNGDCKTVNEDVNYLCASYSQHGKRGKQTKGSLPKFVLNKLVN